MSPAGSPPAVLGSFMEEACGAAGRWVGSRWWLPVAQGLCCAGRPALQLQCWRIHPPTPRPPCRRLDEQEGQGTWYGGGAQVWEQYEALRPPGEEEAPTW